MPFDVASDEAKRRASKGPQNRDAELRPDADAMASISGLSLGPWVTVSASQFTASAPWLHPQLYPAPFQAGSQDVRPHSPPAFEGASVRRLVACVRLQAETARQPVHLVLQQLVNAIQSGAVVPMLVFPDRCQRLTGDLAADEATGGKSPADPDLARSACEAFAFRLARAAERCLERGDLEPLSDLTFFDAELGLTAADADAVWRGQVSAVGIRLAKSPAEVKAEQAAALAACAPPAGFTKGAGWNSESRAELLRQMTLLESACGSYEGALIELHKAWGYSKPDGKNGGPLAKVLTKARKERSEPKASSRRPGSGLG